jgi:hypothetical protein
LFTAVGLIACPTKQDEASPSGPSARAGQKPDAAAQPVRAAAAESARGAEPVRSSLDGSVGIEAKRASLADAQVSGRSSPADAQVSGRSSPADAQVSGRSSPADTARGPEPVGGSWVTCYGNYRPTSTPERDVTRLGLLCGPANGMKLVGSMITGEATENGVEHPLDVRPGDCFRIFAVAEPSAPDLGIELRDPKGSPVASDHNNDRWPILNPDGPLCLVEAGKYAVRVHARQGRGKYALQIWRLP